MHKNCPMHLFIKYINAIYNFLYYLFILIYITFEFDIPVLPFSPSQDLIDEWKAKEIKRGNSNKTIDPSSLKWTPPKGT